MKINFTLGGGLLETLDIAETRAEDLGPPCRSWGGYKRAQVKAKIESGDLPPLAESTLQKRRRTGTSKITRQGHLRAGVARRLDARRARIDGLIRHYEESFGQRQTAAGVGLARRRGGTGAITALPPDVQKKVDRLRAAREAINRQLVKAQETSYADRKTGKTVADKKGDKRFPKLGSTIRMQVVAKGASGTVVVRCSAGVIGKVQNEGGPVGNGAEVPPTDFLVLTSEDIEVFKAKLIKHGISIFEEDAA